MRERLLKLSREELVDIVMNMRRAGYSDFILDNMLNK